MSLSLTSDQIQIIVDTWKIPSKNIFDSGDLILYRFFKRYPEYMQYFKKFRDVPLEQLRGKAVFRAHASRILNRFSATVDCLQLDDGLEEIRDIWLEVGTNHVRFNVPSQAFKDLKIIILEVMTEVCNLDQNQAQAWEILIDYLNQICFETLGHN